MKKNSHFKKTVVFNSRLFMPQSVYKMFRHKNCVSEL